MIVAERSRVSDAVDPDVALMLRVQRDEPGAFAELVATYESRVFGRLVRCVSDRHQAEDLTQEVLLRVYRNRKRYEPRARFSTWVFHIAQNLARNAIRSRRRNAWLRFSPLDRTESLYPERFSVTGDFAALDRKEDASLLRAGLDALAANQRRALELQHFQGRSYPEIGRDLALTAKAAKSLLYRARVELREKLVEFASEA